LDIKALKNKRVLITAGPTWVPIDSVRAIGNLASGETGIRLAEKLKESGAKVTLCLGPVPRSYATKGIKLIRFVFFDELKRALFKEIASKKYDLIIHSAAVSDFRPKEIFSKKISSGLPRLKLELVRNPKLLDSFRKIDASLKIVAFKFEPRQAIPRLIKEAKGLLKRSGSFLVIANTVTNGRYNAYIVSQNTTQGPIKSKADLTEKLVNKLGETL